MEIWEKSDRLMYISVHDGNRSWCWDMQVNPRLHGCVTIKEDREGQISIKPSNPEPRWIKFNKEDRTLPNDSVKIHQRPDNVEVYLAKVNWGEAARATMAVGLFYDHFCEVWRENGELRLKNTSVLTQHSDRLVNVDLLLAREYVWVNAQRGNMIPPNAVKTTLQDEERYVGRVGGEKVCAVSITDGMIDYFVDINSSKTTSGEILLLTVDPSV